MNNDIDYRFQVDISNPGCYYFELSLTVHWLLLYLFAMFLVF